MLLDFWATWCLPCRAEIPHLRAAYEKYRGQGFEIVGLSLDGDDAETVRRFVGEQNMSWPQILKDAPAIAQKCGVSAIPAPLLINGDTGEVLARGDDVRGEALPRTIEKHLKTRPG